MAIWHDFAVSAARKGREQIHMLQVAFMLPASYMTDPEYRNRLNQTWRLR